MASRDNLADVEFERTRSTPLKPIVWMTSVLAWASVIALGLRVSKWASVFLCALTGISFLSFLIGYIYLFVNERETLRAEKWRKRRTTSLDGPANQRTELNNHPPQYLTADHAAEVTSFGVSTGEEKVSVRQTTRMRHEDQ